MWRGASLDHLDEQDPGRCSMSKGIDCEEVAGVPKLYVQVVSTAEEM